MNYKHESTDCCQEDVHTTCGQDNVEAIVQQCGEDDISVQICYLQQNALSLVERAAQIFEDIAAIAVAAQISLESSGKCQYYIENLQHHIKVLEGISIAIAKSEAELENLKQAACEQARSKAQEACEQTICAEQEAHSPDEYESDAEQTIKICTKCNTANLEKHDYCFKCGNKFNAKNCNDDNCDTSHKSSNIDLLQNYLQQGQGAAK